MNERKRGIGRVALYATVIGAMVLSLAPAGAQSTAAQGQSRTINNFTVAGRFLEIWSAQGNEQANVYVNGLPITNRRPEISVEDGKTYETQWFERARYEAHPENQRPYDVLLGRLGATLVEGRGSVDPNTNQLRNPADRPFAKVDRPANTGANLLWFPETGHTLKGKILEYWNRYGGLQQFGFPLSEEFQEVSQQDGKTYTVQYFERNRFELHPEKQAPYEVELGLLGVEQFKLTPVAAASLPQAPPANVQSTKDTLVIGMSQEPSTLFGPYVSAVVSSFVQQPLFNDLTVYNEKAEVIPEQAWYVPTLENGGARFVGVGDDRYLQVKFKMRRGLKWSDGQDVDSNDVLYTFRLTLDPRASITNRIFAQKLANIDNPDKYTVIQNFMSFNQVREFYNRVPNKEAYNFLETFVQQRKPVTDPLYFFTFTPYPEHVLGRVPADKILEFGFGNKPEVTISNGPFRLERWDAGQQIVLGKNPNYGLTAPALLNRIVYRFISDTNQLAAQLRAGAIDVGTQDAFTAPSELLTQLEQAGLKVYNVVASSWEHIDFNLRKPYFQEKAVRQAIAHAINRQRIVNEVTLGQYAIGHSFITPNNWASPLNETFPNELKQRFPLKQYEFDVNKANQMLDQAGWTRGGDGIRQKGGVRLSFNYETTAGNQLRARAQALVQQDLRAVGIDARIRPVPASVYFGANTGLVVGDFDFGQYAFSSPPDPDGDVYDKTQIPTPQNNFSGQNYPGWSNDRFSDLNALQGSEFEEAKRLPYLAEMQMIYSEELPSVQLFVRSNLEVTRPNLVNWQTSGTTVYSTWRAAALYFR